MREPWELTRSPTIVGRRLLHERRGGDHRRDVRGPRGGAGGDVVTAAALLDRGDVLRRGAAAAADEADAVALHEVAQRLGQRAGLLGEDRLAVRALMRDAGVRDAVHRHRRVLAEEADRVAHVLGAGGAVEADHVDLQRLERRERGADVGAQQHLAAVGEQGDGGLDRHAAADDLERLAHAEDRGLDLEDVLRGLDDQEVDAALEQALRLLGEDLHELAEADLAERWVLGRGQEAGRADRARHEAVLAHGLARDLRGLDVDLVGELGEPPLLQLQAAGLERVGLDDLRPRLDHRRVHALDDVGPVEHQRLMAPARQAVVLFQGEVELLERGAHAAVEDDDAVTSGGKEVAHGRDRLSQP